MESSACSEPFLNPSSKKEITFFFHCHAYLFQNQVNRRMFFTHILLFPSFTWKDKFSLLGIRGKKEKSKGMEGFKIIISSQSEDFLAFDPISHHGSSG